MKPAFLLLNSYGICLFFPAVSDGSLFLFVSGLKLRCSQVRHLSGTLGDGQSFTTHHGRLWKLLNYGQRMKQIGNTNDEHVAFVLVLQHTVSSA
jgi:hypothetical protein